MVRSARLLCRLRTVHTILLGAGLMEPNALSRLLALALGATPDAAELARTRGVSAARLHVMKDDIRKSCHRPDLSVHTIAARHGVSVRYVQRTFEESGCTFTQYVTEQRLTAAYKGLRRRTPAHVPISAIAFDCGFADVIALQQGFPAAVRLHAHRRPKCCSLREA